MTLLILIFCCRIIQRIVKDPQTIFDLTILDSFVHISLHTADKFFNFIFNRSTIFPRYIFVTKVNFKKRRCTVMYGVVIDTNKYSQK
jgi:hypothetical protein